MKKKLLLADDSVTIQKVVQITFSHDDYDLTVVDNGDMAYEKARSQRPDLILADVFMPGKNGYELCAAVKNDPSLASVPVLLLTGTFEPFDEAKARSVGADRWIAKPFESQSLIACVEDLLRLATQAQAVSPSPVSTPPPSVSAEEVEFAPPSLSSDLPDDIWGTDFAMEDAGESDNFPVAESLAATNQDDLWDVSGFETEAPMEVAADSDDLWGSFDATPSVNVPPVATPAAAETDSWASEDFSSAFAADDSSNDGTDTFALGVAGSPVADEVEILEEVDLLEPLSEYSPEIVLEDTFATDDDFSFAEEASQMEEVATPSVLAPTVATPLPLSIMNVAPLEVEESLTAGAGNSGSLSEAQLELIVERVADVVISRLAGTLLEKIAWEVVPDLAETMIKEELRKIRESVAAD